MKQLKKDLLAALKSLKTLTEKTEEMAKRLEGLEKAPPAKKRPKRKAVVKAKAARKVVGRKPAKGTAIGSVLAVISRRKKGVDLNDLRKRTGLTDKHLGVILFRLKKRGLIKSAGKGIYVKA